MSNVPNYKEQGGQRWVVGGELEILPEAKLILQGSELVSVKGLLDSTASTIADLKKDFNALLALFYEAGIFVADLSEFLDVILDAQELLAEAKVGTEEGEYPEAAYDTFTTAIASAEAVFGKVKPTQSEIDSAKTTLLAAVSTFEAAVITD